MRALLNGRVLGWLAAAVLLVGPAALLTAAQHGPLNVAYSGELAVGSEIVISAAGPSVQPGGRCEYRITYSPIRPTGRGSVLATGAPASQGSCPEWRVRLPSAAAGWADAVDMRIDVFYHRALDFAQGGVEGTLLRGANDFRAVETNLPLVLLEMPAARTRFNGAPFTVRFAPGAALEQRLMLEAPSGSTVELDAAASHQMAGLADGRYTLIAYGYDERGRLVSVNREEFQVRPAGGGDDR